MPEKDELINYSLKYREDSEQGTEPDTVNKRVTVGE
jgi:hypothetical protein